MFFILSLISIAIADDVIFSRRVENNYIRNQNINIDFYFDKSINRNYFYNENALLTYFNDISNKHNKLYKTNEKRNCGSDELNIIILPKEKMNDSSLMGDWVSGKENSKSKHINLVGLFKYSNGESNIYLQKVSNNKFINFAHEISHFWYRKRCKDVFNYDLNENIALGFEEYIKRYSLLE